MNNLKLYKISDEYITYLQKYDKNVKDNNKTNNPRPYIGVVIQIGNINYYIPICSKKFKHESMRDTIDFIKLETSKKLISVVNINSMIPVLNSEIELIDFNKVDLDYKNLLITEFILISKKKNVIVKNSQILYEKITKHKEENLSLSNRCCDYLKLEEKMKEYKPNLPT
jgi:protein AbiQ